MLFEKTSLGDFAEVQGGYAYKSKDLQPEGFCPVIKIKNVRDGFLSLGDVSYVREDLASQTTRFLCETGDVLISMTGSGPNAPDSMVGRVARVRGSDLPALINQRVGRLLIREAGSISQDFLYYCLSSRSARNYLVSSSTGSANQANINAETIKSLQIPKISYRESLEIGEFLSKFDDKIEVNRKMNQTLEEIAKAIFKSWFVNFDPVRAKAEGRPTGLPPEISDLFPDELVDSEIGEIPKGWEVLKVKDEAVRLKVGKLYSNKTVEKKGSIPVLDQSDTGIIGYHSNDEFVSASFENPVFTFANHTCNMRLLFSNFGVIQNVIPIQSKSYPTIWFYLRTLGIKNFEEYKGHIPDFMDTQLCFPSVPLAKSLNQLVTPLFHRVEIADRENRVLAELRDTLLPKLISGEMRIPDAEKFLGEAGI